MKEENELRHLILKSLRRTKTPLLGVPLEHFENAKKLLESDKNNVRRFSKHGATTRTISSLLGLTIPYVRLVLKELF